MDDKPVKHVLMHSGTDAMYFFFFSDRLLYNPAAKRQIWSTLLFLVSMLHNPILWYFSFQTLFHTYTELNENTLSVVPNYFIPHCINLKIMSIILVHRLLVP